MIDDGKSHFTALHLDPGQTARVGGIKRAFRRISGEIEREEGFIRRGASTEMRPGDCGESRVVYTKESGAFARNDRRDCRRIQQRFF